ncbi:MAG: hypothetical protein K2J84_03795 [Bacteroidaceae bacterium]|nr:hypothetical protein [Bacteroidaceae bacterium]
MTSVALNNLWNYLQGLQLTARNKDWLMEKLHESKQEQALSNEIVKIPKRYRTDPYKVSPSGDPYWADIRNVKDLKKVLQEADEEMKQGTLTPVKVEDLWR